MFDHAAIVPEDDFWESSAVSSEDESGSNTDTSCSHDAVERDPEYFHSSNL